MLRRLLQQTSRVVVVASSPAGGQQIREAAWQQTYLQPTPTAAARHYCNRDWNPPQLGPMTTGSSKFKIYTKTGDKGSAALYNGERRPKDDATFHALGDVDELNSAVGVAREFCSDEHQPLQEQLEVVQSRLLDVGSAIATPADSSSQQKLQRVQFSADATEQLEVWLDALDEELPPLRNFILPSGGKAAAQLHMARSVCRRAERSVVPLVREELVNCQVGIFLNRLSDYLFTAARFASLKEEKPEVVYRKGA